MHDAFFILGCVCFPLAFALTVKQTNAATCLIIKEIVFYVAGSTKKLSLKHSFCAVFFTYFFNRVL